MHTAHGISIASKSRLETTSSTWSPKATGPRQRAEPSYHPLTSGSSFITYLHQMSAGMRHDRIEKTVTLRSRGPRAAGSEHRECGEKECTLGLGKVCFSSQTGVNSKGQPSIQVNHPSQLRNAAPGAHGVRPVCVTMG